MYRHGDKNLRQYELFPQGGKSDRRYRSALTFTEVYSGTLRTYDELLAAGEMVTLLDGQERSDDDDPAVEIARFETAMRGMSPETKKIFLADCAAAVLPPPCVLHSTRRPWRETVKLLVAVGVIPSPWLAADGSVRPNYTGQLHCAKVSQMMGGEIGNDAKREASTTAHRARERIGSSTSNQADYHFVRKQVRVANGIKILGRPPTRQEVLASPELFEPDARQPTLADNVICASCLRNVASPACMGLVLYAHNHYTGVGLITDVCRACDTSGRPINDALIHYDFAASDLPLGAECLLRLMQRGDGLGEVTDEADDIVAEGLDACVEAAWPARDTPASARRTRPKSLRLSPPAPGDVLMAPAPPALSSRSRSRSPSPARAPVPPLRPLRRPSRPPLSVPEDETKFDALLADATRALREMAGLRSSRAGGAVDLFNDALGLSSKEVTT